MSVARPASAAPASARPPGALLAAIVLAHFWRWGYAYGVSDHDEMLPQVLHRLDPSLFARDWFVQSQTSGVTMRSAFVETLHGLGTVLPLEVAVALLHVLVLVALADGAYRLGIRLGADRLGAALGAFLAVVVMPKWVLGGGGLSYNKLLPEAIGWAFALPAVRLFLDEKRLRAGLLLGLGAWVQFLVGAQTALVLGLAALASAAATDRLQTFRGVAAFWGTAALVAAPVAVPALLAPPFPGAEAVARLPIFELYAQIRVPHHYLFFSFPLGEYARFGLGLGLSVVAFVALQRQERLREAGFLLRLFAIAAVLWVFTVVFTEGLPVLFIAQLQFFKLTVLVTTLSALLIGSWVSGGLPHRLRAGGEALLTRPVLGGSVVALVLVLTVALVVLGVGRPASLYGPKQHAASDLGQVEAWARAHTPVDALFLVPPSNTTFRTHARRAVAANYKPVPFQRGGLHVWLDRVHAVAPAPLPERGIGFVETLDDAYAENAPPDWARLAQRFGADYALVDTDQTDAPPPNPAVFRQGRWALHPLRP